MTYKGLAKRWIREKLAAAEAEVERQRAEVERLRIEVDRGAQRVADRDARIAELEAFAPVVAEDPDDAAAEAEIVALWRANPQDHPESDVTPPLPEPEGEPPQPVPPVVEGEGEPAR